MKCVICKHGQTRPGHTMITLQRGPTTVLFKQVPAQVCDNCGEAYVDEAITEQLLTEAEAAAKSGAELEVHRFEAA